MSGESPAGESPALDPQPEASPAQVTGSPSGQRSTEYAASLRLRALWWATLALAVLLICGVLWIEWRRTSPADLPAVLFRVPVNQADAATLQLLPNVGPTLAERITTHRQSVGPFRDVADLRAVKGIGEKTARRIKPHVTFNRE